MHLCVSGATDRDRRERETRKGQQIHLAPAAKCSNNSSVVEPDVTEDDLSAPRLPILPALNLEAFSETLLSTYSSCAMCKSTTIPVDNALSSLCLGPGLVGWFGVTKEELWCFKRFERRSFVSSNGGRSFLPLLLLRFLVFTTFSALSSLEYFPVFTLHSFPSTHGRLDLRLEHLIAFVPA